MQKFLFATLTLFGALQTLPAFGLVREVALCHTTDGQYSVSIVDNQGIGFPRESHFSATITNSDDETVGKYAPLTYVKSSHSISFGHPSYIDTETKGGRFRLDYRSTNTPYRVIAQLEDGREIRYVNRGEVSCQVF